MANYFTHYWSNQEWKLMQRDSTPSDLLNHTAGNLFTVRGVHEGDTIYVVTVQRGLLYLLGKLVVGKVCDIDEAARVLNTRPEGLWQADDHIVASAATPLDFNRAIPVDIVNRLLFITKSGERSLKFKTVGMLDEQTMRGVRRLSAESAAILDKHLPQVCVIQRVVDSRENSC